MFQQLTIDALFALPRVLPAQTLSPKPVLRTIGSAWRDVTGLAKGVGFTSPVSLHDNLCEKLDDQALYDALWLTWHTLSLCEADQAQFTFELEHKPIRLKAVMAGTAVLIGRPEDF